MKKLSTLLPLLCLACTGVFGQDTEDHSGMSTISLAVVMPSEIKDLTDAQASILENRVKNLVSENGLSAEGGLDGFLIYPKFDINGTQTVSQPLGNITVVKCTLSLFVRQYIPNSTANIVFSSFTRDIAGNGGSESEAINNALTQIRPEDEAFQTFLAKARTRIVSYYVQNCERIMNEAQHAADLQNYDKAFALLLSIPKEATQCYSQVQQESIAIYLKKQRQDCNRYILEAKTYAAAHNYDSALVTLRKVDPESVCKDELITVLNDIVTRVDENDKRTWELLIQQVHDSVEIEKARIEAEGQLAQAYLNGAGKKTYVVNGNGPNAPIQVDQSGQPVQIVPVVNQGGNGNAHTPAPGGLLASTTIKPDIFFDNNIFPSFIISRSNYGISSDLKKYGDIYSCIGMLISNPSMSGTLSYEISPVEDKYFEKVTGSISFTRGTPVEYFPEIPWKYDALKNIQQSAPLSIRFRLFDDAGGVTEMVAKVSVRSIRECITSFIVGGKQEMSTTLAAYVNEENPQIDKILAEGIQKKWVNDWTGYQQGPEELDKQVKAIWKLLSERGIHYSDITGATTNTSNSFTSQIVRPFCKSIANKQANCVEGTILFASILKRIGVRPVMVLKPGHCFLAYHTSDNDQGDLLYLETTILGDIKGDPSEKAFEANYLAALKVGADEFKTTDKNKIFLIDVTTARLNNITPINLSDDCAN